MLQGIYIYIRLLNALLHTHAQIHNLSFSQLSVFYLGHSLSPCFGNVA